MVPSEIVEGAGAYPASPVDTAMTAYITNMLILQIIYKDL